MAAQLENHRAHEIVPRDGEGFDTTAFPLIPSRLDERKDSSSSSGLFFLPDWMRGTNSEGSRSQVVLMLEVIRDDEYLGTPL